MGDARSAGAARARRLGVHRVYVLVLLAACLLAVPAGLELTQRAPFTALLWVTAISVANFIVIPMLPGVRLEVSLGAPVTVAAAVALDPSLALLVNLLSVTSARELKAATSPWFILFNRAQLALAAGAASLLVRSLSVPSPWLLQVVLATAAATVAYNLVNIGAVTVNLWLLGRLRLREAARGSAAPFPQFAADFALVTQLALLVVVLYEALRGWAFLLLTLPLALGYDALRSARMAEDRALQLAARVRELEALNRLGAALLSTTTPQLVASAGAQGLRAALDVSDVQVRLDGDVDERLATVKIPGAEPAAIGVPTWLDERATAVVDAVAQVLGMVLQRLELERELADNERARVALTGRILEEATRERSRIAMEIHDEVLPYLAAAAIQSDNVRTALDRDNPTVADTLALATSVAVQDGIARLREVLEALRRKVVVPGGLRPALTEALDELRLRHGVEGRVEAGELSQVPLAVEILVLETVLGCLANIARHANASHVTVALDLRGSHLHVEVHDDGRGFDPRAVPTTHHGLALMRQRVELARGRFTLSSAPDQGTRVRLEVPV